MKPLLRRTLSLLARVLLVVAMVCESIGAADSFTDQGHPGGWIAVGIAFICLSALL